MTIFDLKCPFCGAPLNIDHSQEFITCPYCDTTFTYTYENADSTRSATDSAKQEQDNGPNLYISFNSSDPRVGMVTRIVATGQKNKYVNGTTNTFRLTPGHHTIVLKIGRRNYDREIYIGQDNAPVRISAGYARRAFINIDQPSTPLTGTSGYHTTATTTKKKKSALSIVAFVVSMIYYVSPFAILLAAFDLLAGDSDKNHVFSYIALGFGIIIGISMLQAL